MSKTVNQMTRPSLKAIEHIEAAIAQLKQITPKELYEAFPWTESAEIRAALKILTDFSARYEKRDKVTIEVVRVAQEHPKSGIFDIAGSFYTPS